MSTEKSRNCMDLTEAEDIKKWQENTELYQKKKPTKKQKTKTSLPI